MPKEQVTVAQKHRNLNRANSLGGGRDSTPLCTAEAEKCLQRHHLLYVPLTTRPKRGHMYVALVREK